ncbi:SMI1/KNR4 family protein [Bacillus sp. FJAT-29953]|nr:SMI1/KNR4 family protein [Bacillus sp. FJAT-29953]
MVLWKQTNGPMNLEQIQMIERFLNIAFPKEYVTCVMAHDGGHPEPNRFDTAKRKGYVMDRLLTFREDPVGLLSTIYYCKEALPHGVVPFGYEQTGDIICFDFKDNPKTPSIVLWKHELAPEEEDVGSQEEMRRIGLEYMNNSFIEFITSLY